MAETLLISLQGIGNNILALPLAAAIARADGAPVTMAVRSERARPLLTTHSAIGDVVAVADGVAGLRDAIRRIRPRGFRRAVLAHPTGRRSVALAVLAGVGDRVGVGHAALGPWRHLITRDVGYEHGLHDLEHMERIGAVIGASIDWDRDWPALAIEPETVEAPGEFLRSAGFDLEMRYAGLHTGCDDAFTEKRWPERRFAEFAEALYKQAGLGSIVFDGPAEAGSGRRVAAMADAPVVAMDGWGTITDALGMLSFCDVFVAGDSGLMNMAAAAGVPTVAIFGPSELQRTRPWGEGHRVVRAQRPCVPCYGLGLWPGCLHPDRPCMEDVSVDDVLAAALEALER